jgi:hypothetical protein
MTSQTTTNTEGAQKEKVVAPIQHHGENYEQAREDFNNLRQAVLVSMSPKRWSSSPEVSALND